MAYYRPTLEQTHPHLIKEWHPIKNEGLTPNMFSKGNLTLIWWQCEKGHEWQTKISNRASGAGCPYCSHRKLLKGFNDFATLHPELAAEWHPTLNGDLQPDMIFSKSDQAVWWKCSNLGCDHEWKASPMHRKTPRCRYCKTRKKQS